MKKMKTCAHHTGKTLQWTAAAVMILMLLCSISINAFAAADSPSLDWSMSGQSSIAVELRDDDGSIVTDGTLTLYQVALLKQDDGDMVYTFTDGFASSGVSPDDVSGGDPSLAEELADYVSANSGITGTVVKNTDGTVVFDGLELGLYLIVQTTRSDGYYTMNPFVVSVPLDEDDVWVYTVNASPKVGVLTPEPEESSTTPNPSEKKTVDSKLPQTGQLIWPVPVLAAAGALLLAAGSIMVRSERKKAAAR